MRPKPLASTPFSSHKSLLFHPYPPPPPPPTVGLSSSSSSLPCAMAESQQDSNAQLLQELDALSRSLYQSHTARRTASLVLPRSSGPAPNAATGGGEKPRSRRMSMSPWRSSHPNSENESAGHDRADDRSGPPSKQLSLPGTTAEKKGIWSWKPMRALSHIGMQRLGCLFSVEVVAIQGLPASMNGLRLSVAVRKKETKEGALQTMPARVMQGSADFEETLFLRCHVYCSGGTGTGKPLKFEPRPFLISTMAIDAPELDFGRSSVDLSQLVRESMQKNLEGERVRQWDATYPLAGKAKGGDLMVKLSFQIMEDGGVGIYKQAKVESTANSKGKESSFSFARKKSKASFSVTSPKITRSEPSFTPIKESSAMNLKEIDEFSLDDPAPPSTTPPRAQKLEPEVKEELDIPEFEVIDKGVEILAAKEGQEREAEEKEEAAEGSSVSSEVVKEILHDSAHRTRLTELDAIAQQIKALESLMVRDEQGNSAKTAQEDEMQRLDAEEDAVTREFLQLLELEEGKEQKPNMLDQIAQSETGRADGKDGDKSVYISDLGKGLGSVVQTRDGGFLSATNPLDVRVTRKETPKLAMQISKPFILVDQKLTSGLELFQRLSAVGAEELGTNLQSLTAMDDLMGKTAEQIAFEGMASAIISGRNKEGASSSAAKSVASLKTMASALSEGRRERISTGIWNVREEPISAEEILAFCLQKIEAMAVEALRIQAGMAEEEAPFDVSPLLAKAEKSPLEGATPQEAWEVAPDGGADSVALLVVVQLRDPMRRYETVGAPWIAVMQAARVEGGKEEEARFKVSSLHGGGLRLQGGGRRSAWDGERQRLTAMQWLVAYGLVKAAAAASAGKKRAALARGGQDAVWSMSSRVMADMWLKPMRNPDVKIPPPQQ